MEGLSPLRETAADRERYSLTFVSRALLVRETVLLAELREPGESWESVRDRAVRENIVQGRAYRSGVRLTREAIRRLVVLTDAEVALLLDSTMSERAQLMWAAACRAYSFIGDFAEQVLRERYLLMTPTLTVEHLAAFIGSQSVWHPEVAELTESMSRGVKQTVFRMMREAELVTAAGAILPVLLTPICSKRSSYAARATCATSPPASP
ncbi:DUF1819 family protein [Oerskovia sp. M15]